MLSGEELKEVKEIFISKLRLIKRKDADIDSLIDYLTKSGFFDAPASTQYHCSFPGGLALHSLNVLSVMIDLTAEDTRYADSDSVLIVGLLHDLGKIDMYEPSIKNEKIYSSSGAKSDELGRYDWVSTRCYKVKDAKERKFIGNKGNNAYFIASQFLPLTQEETIALMYQYSAVDREPISDLSNILAKYNLCVYLHSADILATYCIERVKDDK